MAEIALLDPRILPRVVQQYEAPENLLGLASIVRTESDDQPSWEYDIEVHTRGAMMRYNTPNSEAFLLDQLPVGTMAGGYAYQRVKKAFNPTTLRLLRRLGETRASAAAGEERVARETEDMRMQMMRAQEWAVWQMLQGSWSFKVESGISYTIDFKIPSTHKITVANPWGHADDNPIDDIANIKRVMSRNTGFPITRAYMNAKTMSRFIELPEVSGQYLEGGNAQARQGLLSDEQRRIFNEERVLRRWHAIDWIEYDAGYLGGDGTLLNAGAPGDNYANYIPDNVIIFLIGGGTNPFVLQYGPSLDDDAPGGWTGVFTKTWKEPDPSVRQVLMEEQYMVYVTNPFYVATMNIGAAP